MFCAKKYTCREKEKKERAEKQSIMVDVVAIAGSPRHCCIVAFNLYTLPK